MKRLTLLSCAIVWLLTLCTRAITFYVDVNSTNPVVPYTNWMTSAASIQTAVNISNDGDTVLVTDGVYNAGLTLTIGDLPNRVCVTNRITIQSINGPGLTTIDGNNSVRAVYLGNGAILSGFSISHGIVPAFSPYANGGGIYCDSSNESVINCYIWSNSASAGGGIYGGTVTNCFLAANIASTGGGVCNATVINSVISNNVANGGGGGYQSTFINCKILSNSAPYPQSDGAGVCNSALTNCLVQGNFGAYFGGGMSGCTAYRCVIKNNTATNFYPINNGGPGGDGGGASVSSLFDCELINNVAMLGGGAYQSTLENCIVFGNIATNPITHMLGSAGGVELFCNVSNSIVLNNIGAVWSNYFLSSLSYCCTLPILDTGVGNISEDPMFVNALSNDFHLQSNSPCINSGDNSDVTFISDLDGNPRIVGGTVDIGCYEFQTPVSVISYAWLQQYGLPTDGSVDYANLDGTTFTVYQDWIAGLNPTNPAAVLALQPPAATNTTGLTVSWQSVNMRNYYLQSSTNLSGTPAFTSIQSNIVGQAGFTSFTDTTATNGGPYYYRVGVQ